MSSRNEVLARITQAIGDRPSDCAADYAAIPRHYRRAAELTHAARIDLFIDRLIDYDATVHRTNEAGIPALIAACGQPNLVIPEGFPAIYLPAGFHAHIDRDLDHTALDRASGFLTTCTVAIAATGTIVLQNSAGQGRRAISLIPDFLLCVVREDQVVETVSEAMEFLNASSTLPTTFISGPSATSDIEMTRVKGVHGPRTLEILLVR